MEFLFFAFSKSWAEWITVTMQLQSGYGFVYIFVYFFTHYFIDSLIKLISIKYPP